MIRESNPSVIRRILHIDMDAFYASIEQRDDPTLRQRPVAVGRSEARGVVAAASYEARRYGVRSAMPSRTAQRLCPDLIFIPPHPEKYRAVSAQIHAIFSRYTPLIQPLALDEAALDVTDYLGNFGSATAIAEAIRRDIAQQTQLTASAGVSYNRFLAKLASDQNKPNGLFVITPKQGPAFAASLPVEAFHGIGPATTAKMHALGVRTGADLKRCSMELLRAHFGSAASFYYYIARGIDHRPVEPHRPRKSIGNETTFSQDSNDLPTLLTILEKLTVKVWESCLQRKLTGCTVTVKIRTNDFQTSTRARTLHDPINNQHMLFVAGKHILESFFPLPRPVRLLGITVSGLVPQDKADTQLRLSFLDPS
ncbi:DNA polymerase IV [Saccharibacter floricola]|uniref:DNA polymerase IV n=1 Tax=Saccharibacter floricola DSM 15669 TaxID=1123227 RepID=A0ABQ0NXQ5_9PROT|nr:DNA polymerase IV [Saccharibacter floricola]GBQ06017.1 DNA polymerase IV [Saccharibacter floricola DSM 15669]